MNRTCIPCPSAYDCRHRYDASRVSPQRTLILSDPILPDKVLLFGSAFPVEIGFHIAHIQHRDCAGRFQPRFVIPALCPLLCPRVSQSHHGTRSERYSGSGSY
jgi:hypothetical protein